MSEWFEDEVYWEKLYPFLFQESGSERAEHHADSVLDLVGLNDGDVLDLACGPGLHAVALAKKGFRVTGADLSPFLLRKAKDRARAESVNVELLQDDMRHFVRPEAFDLVINLTTSFGYFDDKKDDLRVLGNIYRSLRKGGVLVIDVMGKEVLAKGFMPTTSTELGDGRILVQRHEVFDEWTRIRNQWIVIEGESTTTFRFHLTVYSGQELKELLLQVGFVEVRLFGGVDGSEYGLKARRLVAVARK